MIKRVISVVAAALTITAACVGCSCSSDNKTPNSTTSSINSSATDPTQAQPNMAVNSAVLGKYTNQNYNYSLTIPDEVEDKIAIKGNDAIVYIYDKAILESQGEHKGLLAHVFVEKANAEIPYENYDVLYKDDTYAYIIRYPNESEQYDKDDEEAKKSYQECKKYLQDIADSFTLN